MFDVQWTGAWPCLCFGEWIIRKNGVDVSCLMPDEMRHCEMNTAGTYSSWHFEDWEEVFEDYEDGLECEEWIADNAWISELCDSHEEMVELFYAIQAQDWRHGSCGGCI